MKTLFIALLLCCSVFGCSREVTLVTPAEIALLPEHKAAAPVQPRSWHVAFTEPEGWTRVFTSKEYVAEFRNDMLDASIGLRAMEFVAPIVPDDIVMDFRAALKRDMATEVDSRSRDFRSFPEKENRMSGVMAWYAFGEQQPSWRERHVALFLPRTNDHLVLIVEGEWPNAKQHECNEIMETFEDSLRIVLD